MTNRISRTLAGATAVSVAFAGVGTALAAEWFVKGAARQQFLYDDNVGLNRTNGVSDFASNSRLRVEAGGRDEVLELGLTGVFDFTRFFDESRLDSDDQRIAGEAGYKSRLGHWRLALSYDRDTTRTSEEDDTGTRILANERREAFHATPSWSYQVTELNKVTLRGDFADVRYDGQLIDYRRYSGAVGWTHSLTPMNEIDLFATYARVEPDTNVQRETDVVSLEAGWQTKPVRGMTLRITGGGYWAKTDFDPTPTQTQFRDDESAGVIASARVEYVFDPTWKIDASYTRAVEPSGSGNMLARDTVDASVVHDVSPSVILDLAFRYRGQDSIEDRRSDRRDFVRVVPAVTWKFARDWDLRTSYRFRWQSLEGRSGDASSHAVLVSVSYRPMRWLLAQ